MNSESPEPNTTDEAAPKRPRGIYLLPNLFTTAALFSGFYAVLASMDGNFEKAAIAIFVAMILDGLDGRVARATNTQTSFGAEYDSLSDMIAFGLAPSIMMYEWAMTDLGKLGWLAAFIYTTGAALRLARFNTQIGTADKRFFVGLPSPSAAAILAGALWVSVDNGLSGHEVAWIMVILTISAGLLMVSNILFSSFKQIDLKGKVPFIAIVGLMIAGAIVVSEPPIVLFGVFMLYVASGPVLAAWRWIKKRS